MLDRRITAAIALMVAAVWCLSFVADVFIDDYDPPSGIGTAMAIIVGAAFADNAIRKRNGNGNKPSGG